MDIMKSLPAHVVPYFMGDPTMEEIFGNGHTVWSDQNGLLLHSSIERLLDGDLITIVPESDDKEEETGLKIRVLERNKDWLNKKVVMDSTPSNEGSTKPAIEIP